MAQHARTCTLTARSALQQCSRCFYPEQPEVQCSNQLSNIQLVHQLLREFYIFPLLALIFLSVCAFPENL